MVMYSYHRFYIVKFIKKIIRYIEAVQCSDQGNDVRQDFFRRQNVLTDAVVSENTTLQGWQSTQRLYLACCI